MGFIGNVLLALIRLIAFAALLAGLSAFGFFVAVLAAADGRAQQPLGQVWFQHDPFIAIAGTQSLPLLGAIVERKIHPLLWNPFMTSILAMPSATALFVIGFALCVIAALMIVLTGRRPQLPVEKPSPVSTQDNS